MASISSEQPFLHSPLGCAGTVADGSRPRSRSSMAQRRAGSRQRHEGRPRWIIGKVDTPTTGTEERSYRPDLRRTRCYASFKVVAHAHRRSRSRARRRVCTAQSSASPDLRPQAVATVISRDVQVEARSSPTSARADSIEIPARDSIEVVSDLDVDRRTGCLAAIVATLHETGDALITAHVRCQAGELVALDRADEAPGDAFGAVERARFGDELIGVVLRRSRGRPLRSRRGSRRRGKVFRDRDDADRTDVAPARSCGPLRHRAVARSPPTTNSAPPSRRRPCSTCGSPADESMAFLVAACSP